MHRLLVESAALSLSSPGLPAEVARHLKVLRPRDGEELELFDGRGSSRVYRYDASARLLQAAHPLETFRRDASSEMVLFACVTKGSRWDWTIEKATELGVTRIVPVISARTIVRIPVDDREEKRKRWQRIAEAAAEQSDVKWLPEIMTPVDFAEAMPLVVETDCYVGALTDPPPKMIRQAMESAGSSQLAKPPAIFVGPEGDFTPDELALLIAIATPVSFGATILRAETAAIYGVSAIKTFFLN